MSVYTWGLGKHGQLCNAKTDNLIVPYHVSKCVNGKKLPPVIEVECGAHFTAFLCCDGSLYTCGCGKYGRLGHGDEELNCSKPTQVADVPNVKKISCGFWHASCVTESGDVFIWGYGKAVCVDSDKYGRAHNVGVPKLLSLGPGIKVAGVSCGHNYTYAWTMDGQTYSWGRGQHGVLGLGSDEDVTRPKLVDTLKETIVVNVGAGHSHCGIVSTDGDLYMTGSGSYGALGLSTCSQQQCIRVPTKVLLSDGQEVKEVSCSKGEHHHHTLALLKDGIVLAWGDGYKGKLGLGDQESKDKPTVIHPEHFNNERVVRVSAGGIHSAASTDKGSVYTWGCGSDGRLGHPEAEGHRYLFRSDIPRKVDGVTSDGNAPALILDHTKKLKWPLLQYSSN